MAIYLVIKKTFAIIVSLGLFLGGILLLALQVPFWSLFLGLPSVQTGIIFIIFAFYTISQEEVGKELRDVHQVPCALCGQPTFTRGTEVKGICSNCDKKILGKIEKIKSS